MKGRIKRPKPNAGELMLPRIGKIKTGYKTPSGQPRSVDYFLASGKYAKLFHDAYGEKPQTLQIVFVSDNPEKSCFERYEYRDQEGRLFASGDGETFEVWSVKDQEYKEVTIGESPNLMASVEKRCPSPQGWTVTLSLKFILPKVKKVAGLWEFSTKGVASTIPNIRDAFDTLNEHNGFVSGVIFDLNVEFAKSQKPGSKSRYPVVTLVPNESDENMKIAREGLFNVNKQLGAGE